MQICKTASAVVRKSLQRHSNERYPVFKPRTEGGMWAKQTEEI